MFLMSTYNYNIYPEVSPNTPFKCLALRVKFSADDILKYFSYFFPEKKKITFHANCLQLWRQFARNIESCFLGKIRIIFQYRAQENRKNSRSGPKLRILDWFQTPQNANKSVQQVCALNPIFPKPTNFHWSMMSKKSQTVKSFQTDNVRAPFKCDIMVVKRL